MLLLVSIPKFLFAVNPESWLSEILTMNIWGEGEYKNQEAKRRAMGILWVKHSHCSHEFCSCSYLHWAWTRLACPRWGNGLWGSIFYSRIIDYWLILGEMESLSSPVHLPLSTPGSSGQPESKAVHIGRLNSVGHKNKNKQAKNG